MSKNSNVNSDGIGIGTLLFMVFLVLKLTNVIDWSWWWVTSPLWIPFSIVVLCMIIMIAIYFVKK